MGELGTSQLGTSQLGEPGDAGPGAPPTDARVRAEQWIKDPFDTRRNGSWDRLLDTTTHTHANHEATREGVQRAHWVDHATDAQLDRIGDLVQVERRQGESNAHFRKRIKLQLPKFTGGATIGELIDLSTIMLNCDPQNLAVVEDFMVEPAHMAIHVDEAVFTGTVFGVDEYRELLQDIRAAGVSLHAVIGDQFTHRSVDQAEQRVNDPDKGYGSRYDPDVGGPYADLITARFDDSGHGLPRPPLRAPVGDVVSADTKVSDTTVVGR